MKNNKRIKAPELATRLEFERAIDDIATTTVALRKLEAARDERLQVVRAEWEPSITASAVRIKNLTLLAEKFAEENRKEIFPGKEKSDATSLATFGFRLGNHALKTMSRGVTWDNVLAALKRLRYRRWIRTKEEPAKDVMLAAAKRSPKAAKALAAIGVIVVQEETFFVEAKDISSSPAKEAHAA